MNDTPSVQQLGAAVLIQGDALRDLYLCLHKGIPAVSAAGHSPVLLHIVKVQVSRALMSARGQHIAKPIAAESDSNGQGAAALISVAEAAAQLGVSQRQMRRLARSCQLGQRFGATWALNRAAVLALASERRKAS